MDRGDERRKYPRVPLSADAPVVQLTVKLVDAIGGESSARIVNIAEEGLYLSTTADLALDAAIHVRFTAGGRLCEARGRVVWLAHPGAGIRLSEPGEEFRLFVRELAAVDEQRRRQLLASVRDLEIHVS